METTKAGLGRTVEFTPRHKPCVCGSTQVDEIEQTKGKRHGHYIKCRVCGRRGEWSTSILSAIDLWNERVDV